jgi:histidinol-phosphate/aromatic aminotransferase/cobyric acid decarboxylase-like protein
LNDNVVQYTRSEGHPRLVNALSNYLSPSMNRELDASTEIVTTVGATEALLLASLALLNPGDEAILIEPFYDSYEQQVKAFSIAVVLFTFRPYPCLAFTQNQVKLAGAIPRFVALERSNDKDKAKDSQSWKLNIENVRVFILFCKTFFLILHCECTS